MSQFARTLGGLIGTAAVVSSLPLSAAASPTATSETMRSTPAHAATFNGNVLAIAISHGTVYVGGNFTAARDASGTVQRSHLAAIDATTGQLRRWNPGANGEVDALAATKSRVYVGGEFDHLAGHVRRHLGAVTTSRQADIVRGWRQDADRYVKALVITKSGLYVGGGFHELGGVSRSGLALVRRTGALDPNWHPRADDTVLALAAHKRRVYVGGLFRTLNGHSEAAKLAAVNRRSGRLVKRFNPLLEINVHGLDISRRLVFAAADGTGGHLRAYGPAGVRRVHVATDGGVNDVAVLGGSVYFGGHFDHVCKSEAVGAHGTCLDGSWQRGKLAAVSRHGRLRRWNPEANSLIGALALAASHHRVFAGGAWQTLRNGAVHRPHFAKFAS